MTRLIEGKRVIKIDRRSEEVGGGSKSSNGGSEGSSSFLEIDNSVVSRLDDSVVSSVSSEVFVTIKVSSDELHDSSTDGEGVMENSPSHTFPARRGSERTFIGVELLGVKVLHEGFKRNDFLGLSPPVVFAFSRRCSSSRNFLKVHGIEESVSNRQALFTVFDVLSSLVLTVGLSEHKSKHGVVNLVVKISILSFLSSSEFLIGTSGSASG